ncbi:MAG TPA: insulinase family protein, partial [Blastocatellia bacterium]|nr:insulinase family protein [Blastocatellia bacterium]
MFRNVLCFLMAASLGLTALATGASAQVRLQRVDFRDRMLANGLRVLSVEDHSSPTVAIQVWYHVGSKDDPDGRSGFAHLFEHI